MKRVLFYKKSNFIGSAGGVEKVLVTLSNALSKKGYIIHLATRDKKQGFPFFAVSDAVIFHQFKILFSPIRRFLGKCGLSSFSYFNREKLVAKILNDYVKEHKVDVVITAGIQDMADLLYQQDVTAKKVVMLHSRPDVYFTKKKEKLFVETLKKVDLVQVLLPSFVPIIKKYYSGKIVVIGNSISLNPFSNKREKRIIYPARIEKNKQQDLLIEAFSKIFRKFPDWEIHFRGKLSDNEYFDFLKSLVEKYSLQDQVFFLEPTPDLDIELSKSSICAFPSKYEGFPLALCEAMASAIPVIGLQSASGVSDLIESEKNGFLVKDASEFSEKLELLMNDETLRNKLGQEACLIVSDYSEDKIVSKWEEVINA